MALLLWSQIAFAMVYPRHHPEETRLFAYAFIVPFVTGSALIGIAHVMRAFGSGSSFRPATDAALRWLTEFAADPIPEFLVLYGLLFLLVFTKIVRAIVLGVYGVAKDSGVQFTWVHNGAAHLTAKAFIAASGFTTAVVFIETVTLLIIGRGAPPWAQIGQEFVLAVEVGGMGAFIELAIMGNNLAIQRIRAVEISDNGRFHGIIFVLRWVHRFSSRNNSSAMSRRSLR
ncbi:MAG: hypothetical protein ABF727_12465 [Gluconobacter oxydans]